MSSRQKLNPISVTSNSTHVFQVVSVVIRFVWWCQESYGESSGGDFSGEEAPCDIGLLERLIRSHPVWFLPGIQRAGAFHLLQGKEDGVSSAS